MSKRQTSLKDLAKTLNVSVSTVSRALKNHPDISPALCQKIQELARSMRYTPNPLAMGLLRRQTRTIGVIIPDIVTHFYSSVLSGIEDVAREHGYYAVVTTSNESYEKEKACVENLIHLRVEGVISCIARTTTDYSHYDLLRDAGIPLVFFDRICRASEFSSVVADNVETAKNITQHFFNTGCRRIAYISGPSHLNISHERLQGYKEGISQCGLVSDENLLQFCNMDTESAMLATKKLLALTPRPDALFAINDTVIFTAIKQILKQNLKIPEDISIIGITDEFHATFMEPELTSLSHPTFEMGKQAASLLITEAQAEEECPARQIILHTDLIIRASTRK